MSSDKNARDAGRGGLALSGAKAFFIVLGFVQQFLLFRVLGINAYGALRSALSPASITYNPIVTTGIQGLSQATTHAEGEQQEQAVRAALKIHALLGTAVAIIFFVAADSLATRLGAPHIAQALSLLSIVIFLYGLYAPLVGVLNGRRRFLAQAGLDMGAAVLRTVGLLVGGWFYARSSNPEVQSQAVNGAVWGFIIGASVILVVAIVLVGFGRPGHQAGFSKRHLAFIVPVLGGQVVLNLLLQADLNTLRYFAAQAAAQEQIPLEQADPLVAAYSAAQLFGFLPYQLMVGISFILFPMLARADTLSDRTAIRTYVRAGVRVATLITGLLVSVCGGLAHELLALTFSPQAADLGAQPMRILGIGLGAFAIFGALITVLNSLKRQWQSLAVTTAAFVTVLLSNYVLVHGQGFGQVLLVRTATSTACALTLATLVTAWLVFRAAGGVVRLLTVVRVAAATLVCITVGQMLPDAGKLVTLAYAALLPAVYCILLLISGELGAADLAYAKSLASRKRSS